MSNSISISDFAKRLEGRQYTSEITEEEEILAKQNNLVVVFGASDDLMELRGSIDDEFDCYNGGSVFIDSDGTIIPQEECENCSSCKWHIAAKSKAHKLSAHWCEGDVASWEYDIDVPFEPFSIMEDEEVYCIGIVFSLDDITNQNKNE